VWNTIQFHSPLKTGYGFWVPYFSDKHLLFLFRYIPRSAVNLWQQLTLQPHAYDAANIFGTGTSFVPAFVLLICAGLLFIRPTWFLGCAFLSGFSSFTGAACYLFGRDGRFYLPVLILLVAVAVLPVTWAATNLFSGRRIVSAVTVFILYAAACIGYPSRSGYNTPGIDRSQAWDAFHFATPLSESIEFIAQKHFARRLSQQDGIVLSDIDPVYLNALLPRSFVAAPIDGKHHYKWSYIWRYDRPQAMALVEHGLQQSVPVYALFTSRDDGATNQSRLPSVPGYEWRIFENAAGNATILKLAPAGSDQTVATPE
jgi:hypothetical protein